MCNIVFNQALGLLCETLKDRESVKTKPKGRRELNVNSIANWFNLEEKSLQSFRKMCLGIVQLIDDSACKSDTSVKLSAFSALEVVACNYSTNYDIFSMCLPPITKCIISQNLTIASSSLRATGVFVNVLGPRALPELPQIMKNMIKKSHQISLYSNVKESSVGDDATTVSAPKESFVHSILITLEAVVDKLGGFLNPYLEDIVKLIVLSPEYSSESKLKLKQRADVVRQLLTKKIPVSFSGVSCSFHVNFCHIRDFT